MRKSFLWYRKKLEKIEEAASPLNVVTYRKLVWMKFKKHRLALMGAIILIFLVLFSFVGPLFTAVSYEDMDFGSIFVPPFSSGHFLGTDELGHDV